MGIFHKKDLFGRTVYKIPAMKVFLWSALLFLTGWSFVWIVGCVNGEQVTFKKETENLFDDIELHAEEKPEPPVKKEPVELKQKKLLSYRYALSYKFTKKLYATCYSQWDSEWERAGIYANNKYSSELHKSERRIQRHHYTVALPPELKEYHNALIQLPDGTWTHKYRVHVPDYNRKEKPVKKNPESFIGRTNYLLSMFNDKHFSLPRDRMRQTGRIDVLFTTAGKYNSIKQRQRAWMNKYTHEHPCQFWEIEIYAVYSDGTEKKVR